jgi:hypothetical protein
MRDKVISGQPCRWVTMGCAVRQLAHAAQVGSSLRREKPPRVGASAQRRHRFANDLVGSVATNRRSFGQPVLDALVPCIGQGVHSSLWAAIDDGFHHLDQAIALEPAERCIDLTERQWPRIWEPRVVIAFEVVSVRGASAQQRQNYFRSSHVDDYTLSVFISRIVCAGEACRRFSQAAGRVAGRLGRPEDTGLLMALAQDRNRRFEQQPLRDWPSWSQRGTAAPWL